jgi:hypothetical protein
VAQYIASVNRLSPRARGAHGFCVSLVACGVFACSSDASPSAAALPSATAPLDPADVRAGAGGGTSEMRGGAGDGAPSGGSGEGQPSLPLEPDRDDPGNGAAPVADAAAPSDGTPRDAGQSEPRPLPRWDLNGIVGTGQSLSVGEQARDVASSPQAFGNLMLRLPATPLPLDPAAEGFGLVPLVEPLRPFASTYPSAYPANIYGETPHTAMANQISSLARSELGRVLRSVHSVVGENGQGMSVIEKGAAEVVMGATSTGRAYAATLFEAAVIARLAREQGLSYGVGAVIITHGEADAGNTDYGSALIQLRRDYEQDLRMITGQGEDVLMLISQQHSVPDAFGSRSASTQAQWRVGVELPGEIVCSGPKYQYAYAADGVHLVTLGYQMLGEKYGQVYYERRVAGRDFQPLQPLELSRAGRSVNVRFHVPVAPLVFDTGLPIPHATAAAWAAGRGFEVWQNERRVTIQSVEIAGDSVVITCAEDIGPGYTLGYAATSDGVLRPGGTRRWGQLRDSDPFVGSTTGRAQPNFAVAFELAIP